VERASPHSDHGDLLLVCAGPFDPDAICGEETRSTIDRQAHIARLHRSGQLSFNPAVRAGHRVPRVAEVEAEPIDLAVHVLVAANIDEDRGGGLIAGHHGRVIEEAHVVGIAGSGDEHFASQAASRRIAPSSFWSYSMSNSSFRPERSVFGKCFSRRWLK
jgi:hypothetical protein